MCHAFAFVDPIVMPELPEFPSAKRIEILLGGVLKPRIWRECHSATRGRERRRTDFCAVVLQIDKIKKQQSDCEPYTCEQTYASDDHTATVDIRLLEPNILVHRLSFPLLKLVGHLNRGPDRSSGNAGNMPA